MPDQALVNSDLQSALAEVGVPGNRFMTQREHDLGESGDARRRLEVPDVRLDRADGERCAGRAVQWFWKWATCRF